MSSFKSMFSSLNSLTGNTESDDDVGCIDISNISVATLMANFRPDTQDQISENVVRHLVVDTLRNNVLKFKMQYPEIVVAFDDAQNWRKQKAWYYKKKRKMDHDASEWDWERLNSFLQPVLRELIEVMPYKCLMVDFAEADDVIGVVTKHCVSQDKKVMVIAADGDFTQLQRMRGVSQYSPTQKKAVLPKYGSARNDLRMKIIKGDKKDSIACIKIRKDYIVTKVEGERAPAVKAAELEKWLEMDDPTTDMPPEWAERYRENEALLDLDLVPSDIANNIIAAYNSPKKGSKSKMQEYFLTHKLTRMFQKMSDF